MKLNRKPIQIAVVLETDITSETVYALCDDGSIWWLCPGGDNPRWTRLTDVPTDDR